VSLRHVPIGVRAYLYLFWAGMAVGGVGVVGFFLSFWRVGSSAAAMTDVHYDTPVGAYASIAAWVLGLVAMWFSRRKLDAAVAAKLEADRAGLYVDFPDTVSGDDAVSTDAPEGRDS
jgi:hypothetical protein